MLFLVTSSLPAITDVVAIDGTTPSAGDANVHGPGSGTGLTFAAGSSGSSLHNLRAYGFTNSLIIAAGVTGVTVTSSGFGDEALVDGNANQVQNTFFSVLRIGGNANQFVMVPTSTIVVTGDDNRIADTGPSSTIGRIEVRGGDRTIIENITFFTASRPIAIDVSGAVVGATIRNNTIFGYTERGIVVRAPAAGVRITGNSIGGPSRPIDLGGDGATPNDPAPDADLGANNLQNHPVLTRAVLFPSQLVVTGTLTSAPLTQYLIELFSSVGARPAAGTLLASFVVTTDATGNASFTRTITSPLPTFYDVVTATAMTEWSLLLLAAGLAILGVRRP